MSNQATTMSTIRRTGMTIIDAMMGSGKTTWMLNHMNQTYSESLFDESKETPKYLCVVPSLSEVDRFTNACPALEFKNPQPVEGRKLWGLKGLVSQGQNIVTTHALFALMTPEVSEIIREQGYTLVIDEVLTTVDMFKKLSNKDRDLLFENNYVYVEPTTNRLRWNLRDHHDYKGRFDDIRAQCEAGTLVVYRNSILIWEFPVDFIDIFEDAWVLTYMFEGSPMAAYLKAARFLYGLVGMFDGEPVPIEDVDERVEKERIKELVSIYEGPMNDIGKRKGKTNPLSSTWYKNATSAHLKQLKGSTGHFFKKVACTPSKANMWTTFKAKKTALQGPGYTRGWVSNNAKATNDYIERQSLAYLCNIFYQPIIRGYFEDRGITVHEDLFALSEMIQWIWRSQVRRGDPITVFIPSERMRGLLKMWLHSSNTVELIKHQQHEEAA